MNRPNLNDIANKFAESQLQLGSECPLKPFDPDENDTKSWIDPVTKWSLNRIPIGAQIEWVFLLNDWLPENQINKPVGTLDSNVEYCERWYSKPWNEQGKPDATFANLFWCWSRSLLETKRCVVMNTLWGARVWDETTDETTGKKTKEAKTIPDESYEKAKEIICHPLIDWAKPHTIYVCGETLYNWRLREFIEDPKIRPRVKKVYHPSWKKWPCEQARLEASVKLPNE